MGFSYSFHLSAKGHAVTNIGKIVQIGKHNLRAYTGKNYDKNLIKTIIGSNNLLSDVEQIYHQEFDDALEKYNAGKRDDRKINDYLKHVSESRSDIAAEIIIQVGDSDFWADKSIEERKQMTQIFREQIEYLNRFCPNFVVANATIHYDEKSPHMHVIGIPVADGYKKGLERQCAKTKVFTADSLSALQGTMRSAMEESMNRLPDLFANSKLKSKEKGRNKDIPKEKLEEYYQLEKKIIHSKEEVEHWQNQTDLYMEQAIQNRDKLHESQQEKNFLELAKEEIELSTHNSKQELAEVSRSLKIAKDELNTIQAQKNALQGEIERLENTKSKANQSVEKINAEITQQMSALLNLQNRVSSVNSELSALNKALDEKWTAGVQRYGQTSIMERLNKAKEEVDKDKHLRWLETRVSLLERFITLPQIAPFWKQFKTTVNRDNPQR